MENQTSAVTLAGREGTPKSALLATFNFSQRPEGSSDVTIGREALSIRILFYSNHIVSPLAPLDYPRIALESPFIIEQETSLEMLG